MPRSLEILILTGLVLLNGCSTGSPRHVAGAGEVTTLWVEAAPGLYVERRLAEPGQRARLADVRMLDPVDGAGRSEIVRLDGDSELAPGTLVAVSRDTDAGGPHAALAMTSGRVSRVVAPAGAALVAEAAEPLP
ncbi:MAG: hypothetical protein ACU85V_09680 [Gammaproteobacteria bacterium]